MIAIKSKELRNSNAHKHNEGEQPKRRERQTGRQTDRQQEDRQQQKDRERKTNSVRISVGYACTKDGAMTGMIKLMKTTEEDNADRDRDRQTETERETETGTENEWVSE